LFPRTLPSFPTRRSSDLSEHRSTYDDFGRRLCGFPLCFFPVAAAGENVFARHSLHIFEGQRNVATPAHAARLFDSAYLSNCGSALSDDHVAVHYDVSEYLHLNVVTNMGRLTGDLVHSSNPHR